MVSYYCEMFSIALHCSVFYGTALHYVVLYCVVWFCKISYSTPWCCIVFVVVLWLVALCCACEKRQICSAHRAALIATAVCCYGFGQVTRR